MSIVLHPLEISHSERIMQIERLSFHEKVCEDAGVYRRRIETFPQGNLGFFFNGLLIGFFCSELWRHEREYDIERFRLSHDITRFFDRDGTDLYSSSFAWWLPECLRERGPLLAIHMPGLRCRVAIHSIDMDAAREIIDSGFTEVQRIPVAFRCAEASSCGPFARAEQPRATSYQGLHGTRMRVKYHPDHGDG